MRRVRVCIYGGTDLEGTPSAFISCLAYEILASMPAVIVTGGFHHSAKRPQAKSTDVAALEGAMQYASDHGCDLRDCYEAWIPEPQLDNRLDDEGVVRLSEADGITLKVMAGRTSLGRRLAMVAGVDVVLTISGKTHTEIVVEHALEMGIPVLPIPDANGDSEVLLKRYRQRIARDFAPGALDEGLLKVSEFFAVQPRAAAVAAVDLIRTARIGRCLVLLPYDELHNRLYAESIEPCVARHMIPLRLDRLPRSEAIYDSFGTAVRSAAAVIVDITRLNENVMYEVGYVHALGLKPLIYSRNAARIKRLPVYFRTLNVRLVSEGTPLEALVDDYLRSFKAAGQAHPVED